jgi:tetratricopeptide (TPR) repeat protein
VQQRRNNDPDLHYHLGLAYAAQDELVKARVEFERAQLYRAYRAPARLELAFLDAQRGDYTSALDWIRLGIADSPEAVRLGAVEVALLRHLDRKGEARDRHARWQALDPTSSALRFEGTLLGGADGSLWAHLAADPERVLELASLYMRLGLYATALQLLEYRYPEVDAAWKEPGAVLPQRHPLIAYYRAFCRQRMGQTAVEDLRTAAKC